MGALKLTYYHGLEGLEKKSTSFLRVVGEKKPTSKNRLNYFTYGMLLPGRHGSSDNGYKFGFQGQEKDDEIKGEGNSVNYKYRMHDPRIGRFFAVDPLTKKYPKWSPYAFSGNQVIHSVELEGLESGDDKDPSEDASNYSEKLQYAGKTANSDNLYLPSSATNLSGVGSMVTGFTLNGKQYQYNYLSHNFITPSNNKWGFDTYKVRSIWNETNFTPTSTPIGGGFNLWNDEKRADSWDNSSEYEKSWTRSMWAQSSAAKNSSFWKGLAGVYASPVMPWVNTVESFSNGDYGAGVGNLALSVLPAAHLKVAYGRVVFGVGSIETSVMYKNVYGVGFRYWGNKISLGLDLHTLPAHGYKYFPKLHGHVGVTGAFSMKHHLDLGNTAWGLLNSRSYLKYGFGKSLGVNPQSTPLYKALDFGIIK